ncbi:MAG: 2-C-methyl-D-erythritol 4-phosphate cytidylyltransferase [Acidimicrobiales bacterium]|nr:2-C-methyl-D-erythritol 4-phosphate cytidylyltransferase [Acidimicrobiales bacterium]
MSVWAIVVAAGSGSRFGSSVPKQYLPLAGRRVLDWSLAAARSVCDGVVLVVAADRADAVEPLADHVVVGGSTRSASVRAGLRALPGDASVVVVHDAARPAASRRLFGAVVAAVCSGADGAVPGVPVTDTIKRTTTLGHQVWVADTPDRDTLVAVQTPQAFRVDALRAAHASGAEATDDAALVEAAGGRVQVVPGELANRKITVPDDLVAMEQYLGDTDED